MRRSCWGQSTCIRRSRACSHCGSTSARNPCRTGIQPSSWRRRCGTRTSRARSTKCVFSPLCLHPSFTLMDDGHVVVLRVPADALARAALEQDGVRRAARDDRGHHPGVPAPGAVDVRVGRAFGGQDAEPPRARYPLEGQGPSVFSLRVPPPSPPDALGTDPPRRRNATRTS